MLFNLGIVKNLKTSDGKDFRICDYVVDTSKGKVTYLVCKTSAFWNAKKVLVPTDFVSSLHFKNKSGVATTHFSANNIFNMRARSAVRTFSEECRVDFLEGILSLKKNPRHTLKELQEYFIEGPDFNYGLVRDLVVSNGNWLIRFVATEAGLQSAQGSRLVSFNSIKQISWLSSTIYCDVRGIKPSTLPMIMANGYPDCELTEPEFVYSGLKDDHLNISPTIH